MSSSTLAERRGAERDGVEGGERQLVVGTEQLRRAQAQRSGPDGQAVGGGQRGRILGVTAFAVEQDQARTAPLAEVEAQIELVDPCGLLVAAGLAIAVGGVAGARAETEAAAVILVGELTQHAGAAVAMAGAEAAAQHTPPAQEIGAAQGQRLLVELHLAMGLAGEPVGEAVAMGGRCEPVAIVEALAAIVAAECSELIAEIVQARLQEPRADIVGLGDQLLAAEQVGDAQLHLAGTGDHGQALQRERTRRHRTRLALHVVDEHVDYQVLAGEAADGRQWEGHERGVGAEIGGVLDARHAHGRRQGAAGGDGVAQPQRRARTQEVASDAGVEPRHARGAAQVLEQEAGQRRAAGVEAAELDQAAHALIESAAGLIEQVVVEKAAGTGHGWQPLGRRSLGLGADEPSRRHLERQGELVAVERERGAFDGVEWIVWLAGEGQHLGDVGLDPPGLDQRQLGRQPAVRSLDEQPASTHRLPVQFD